MSPDVVPDALAVLDRNRRGAWTCPATGIYPHQWLWDSGFVAIGLARHDPRRAAGELTALLRGQWSNGMIPHVVFSDDGRDAASRRLWGSRRDPRAPVGVDTSCITQPPVLAIAARRVADHLAAAERERFLDAVVPPLLEYHAWLYRARDPEGCGLVTLLHPWECGLDTTPPWMAALRRLRPSAWLRIVSALRLTRIVRAVRRDTRYLPERERASDDDGLRMLDLASRARRRRFDLAALDPARSLLLHDVSFNALLVVANRDLTELARRAGVDVPSTLADAFRSTPPALERLWDEAAGAYCARDATTGAVAGPPTIAQFTMLWAGEHTERLGRLVARLRAGAWAPAHPVPSMACDDDAFDPERYWSGPTWVNTNWLIVQGLHHRGEHDLAEALRRDTLALVAHHGFAEYFSPLSGAPLGASAFSWSAALAVDLATDPDAA